VIANGDITDPVKARYVLDYTGADAIMVGRAAQGNPWIFGEINHYLQTGTFLAPPSWEHMRDVLLAHLDHHYGFYGEYTGVRTARKHIGWYISSLPDAELFRQQMNRLESCQEQYNAVNQWFTKLVNESAPRVPQAAVH
jgi:tRNA-dihydrouridine synthase B